MVVLVKRRPKDALQLHIPLAGQGAWAAVPKARTHWSGSLERTLNVQVFGPRHSMREATGFTRCVDRGLYMCLSRGLGRSKAPGSQVFSADAWTVS